MQTCVQPRRAPPAASRCSGAPTTGSTGKSSTRAAPPRGMNIAFASAPPWGPTATRTRAQNASSSRRLGKSV